MSSALCSVSAAAGEAFKHGAVMARSVVLDESGQPILVEYKADGSEGSVVEISSEYANDVRALKIISAYEYRVEQERLKAYQEQHKGGLARDADVLAREAFLNQTFTTADGKKEITPPVLPEYVKSVLVRGRSARITNDASQLVLLSFSVDLSQNLTPPDTGSIVLNPKGQVITSSSLNIAPRVGFFGDPNKAQDVAPGLRKNDDEIFGPVKNVKLYVSPEVFPGSVAVSDSKGKYSMRFHLPYCPGGFEYTTDMWAELYYANFSPNGMPALPYYLRRQDWTYCYDLPPFSGGGSLVGAMSYVNAMAVVATMSTPLYALDMKVDVMFLSGKVTLKNPDGSPISISTMTEYKVDSADTTTVAQQYYDFDGDGKPDTSVLGNMVDQPQPDGTSKKVFQAQPNGTLQAVYFSSNAQPNGQPDTIRVADKTKKMAPNGLLKSITEEDLRKTDVLVFRESTGELVLERKGLTEEEAKKSDIGNNTGINDKEDHFFYRIMLRGPMDHALNLGGGISRSGTWNEWATRYQLAQPYQKREADHLKSGEWIRLVVINRVTGYMATQRVQLNDASQNAAGFLSLPVKDMVLMPPNLKIWAERDYTHENGLEKGKEERNNLIGAEGAALASDDLVTVYTEWFDEEGRPLPEGLGADKGEQFGLTGRLAKISGPDQIMAVAHSTLANFAIAPGRNTQVLRIKDNFTAPEHFYIHVNGQQKDEKPDFATAGAIAEPPLDTRPKNPTPFLTPLYDENKDWQTWSAWNQIKRAYDAELIAEEPLKPLPSYVWHYRPEYQFSQFGLEMESILREYTDESGQAHQQELLTDQDIDKKIPTIRSNDDLVSVFYSLAQQQYNRLMPIDGEQELIFGMGANEVRATISSTGEIRFDNLAHLDLIDPTDLLTLRLYLNHDAGNTLWEWAFTRNGLHVYYQIPGNTETRNSKVENDIEILSLLESGEVGVGVKPLQETVVRTLGGMRLRYRYMAPSLTGTEITYVEWTINKRGRYCQGYGVDDPQGQCKVVDAGVAYKQTNIPAGDTADVYWEPLTNQLAPPMLNTTNVDWSNWAGTQTTDTGVAAHLKASYTIPANAEGARASRTYETDFQIKTRELKPEPADPMEGSDVQILEAMLWQFGISPQKGSDTKSASNAGKAGARINSDRGKKKSGEVLGWTKNCDGTDAKNRNVFTGGWSGCPSGHVALEGLVQRFNSRSFETNAENIKGATSSKRGALDLEGVKQLGRLWVDYINAVQSTPDPIFDRSKLTDGYWSAFVDAMDGTVKFLSPAKNETIDLSYGDTLHQSAMSATGGSATLIELLKAWTAKENDRQWGANNTNYRISEGGADEVGSIGFSQLWFSYIYGKINKCSKINGVNMYHPQNNLLGFAVWAGDSGCGGSFHKAFKTSVYAIAVAPSTADNLRGYICLNASGEEALCAYQPDNYERLVKGLIGYNAGASAERLLKCSLAEMLAGGVTRGGVNCQSTREQGKGFDYGLTILHGSLPTDTGGVNPHFLKLPHRTFVWVGERYAANLILEDGITPDPKVGTPKWCFKYGEKEWRELTSWEQAKLLASDVNEDGESKTPVGRVACN